MPNPFWLNQLISGNRTHDALKEKYDEWRQLADPKTHFWQWLQQNHVDLFNDDAIQVIIALKNERQSHLKTAIRKSAKFARDDQKIGLSETYWLEALDPLHRKNDQLLAYFKEWKQTKTIQSFWDWITIKYPAFNEAKSVQYFSEQQRKQYTARITSEGIIFVGKSREPYDTSNYKGKQPGYAAFSMDALGNLYLGQHVIGDLHHSSFLSGERIVASGMMKIKRGKIKEINNSSGHYKPTLTNIKQLLQLLKSRREITSLAKDCKIIVTDYSVKHFKFIDIIANWLTNRSGAILIKIGHYLKELNTKTKRYKVSDLVDITMTELARPTGVTPPINPNPNPDPDPDPRHTVPRDDVSVRSDKKTETETEKEQTQKKPKPSGPI